MSKRDYVREELADIERQLADKNPDAIGEDMSDLAAIGLARYDSEITPEQIARLVAVARGHGRSWEEIGSRLSISAENARKAYERRSRSSHDKDVDEGASLEEHWVPVDIKDASFATISHNSVVPDGKISELPFPLEHWEDFEKLLVAL